MRLAMPTRRANTVAARPGGSTAQPSGALSLPTAAAATTTTLSSSSSTSHHITSWSYG